MLQTGSERLTFDCSCLNETDRQRQGDGHQDDGASSGGRRGGGLLRGRRARRQRPGRRRAVGEDVDHEPLPHVAVVEVGAGEVGRAGGVEEEERGAVPRRRVGGGLVAVEVPRLAHLDHRVVIVHELCRGRSIHA